MRLTKRTIFIISETSFISTKGEWIIARLNACKTACLSEQGIVFGRFFHIIWKWNNSWYLFSSRFIIPLIWASVSMVTIPYLLGIYNVKCRVFRKRTEICASVDRYIQRDISHSYQRITDSKSFSHELRTYSNSNGFSCVIILLLYYYACLLDCWSGKSYIDTTSYQRT